MVPKAAATCFTTPCCSLSHRLPIQAKSSEGDAVVVRSLREQLKVQEAQVAEARRLKDQAM